MSNQEVFQQYSRAINALRRQCRDAGMTEEEFKKLYYDSLEENEIITSNNQRTIFTKTRLIIVTILLISIVVYNFKSMYSNLQEFVYPSLQILRRISIPFLSLFPSLTEFYQETCLVQNPFFTVVDMECWPCSTVTSIQVYDEPLQSSQQHSAPYVYKTEQSVVNMNDLLELYQNNEIIFEKEASMVFKNNRYYVTPREMFNTHEKSEERNLFVWKLNTMNTALILRQMIPRPKVVPKFGQSTERYILTDNSKEPFRIPDTDCGYSFVLSLSGSRVIELNPAEECKHQCRTLSIELKETHLLWYNWWYWKPMVLPSNGNETLIAHIGSYC